MSTVTRTIIILLLAALALTACDKHSHTPDDPDQPALIGFAPMSNDAMVKTRTSTDPSSLESLSRYHQDFGVWGIGRKGTSTVNLWGNTFVQAIYNASSDSYIPVADEYWTAEHTYNFIAVAPYTGAAENITSGITAGNQSGDERLSFTFDMGEKYAPSTDGVAPDYDFDLMATVAKSVVGSSASAHTEKIVPLIFEHLLSQINIFVSFSTDLAGEPIEGKITRVKLNNILPAADYTISSSASNVLNVNYSGAKGTAVIVDAAIPADRQLPSHDPNYTIHIVPQLVKTMTLHIDLAINEGSNNWVEYQDIKINLDVPANATPYTYNGKYNWNITIGTGASIKFNVTVGGWSDGTTEDPIEM